MAGVGGHTFVCWSASWDSWRNRQAPDLTQEADGAYPGQSTLYSPTFPAFSSRARLEQGRFVIAKDSGKCDCQFLQTEHQIFSLARTAELISPQAEPQTSLLPGSESAPLFRQGKTTMSIKSPSRRQFVAYGSQFRRTHLFPRPSTPIPS